MKAATIKDIAKICGVGVSTVSRAINNHPDINPETKTRILKAIKEHNYIPNNSARNLKRLDAKAIAILVKGITNPFFSEIIRVMESEINKNKYTLVLHHVDDAENEVDVAIQLIKEKRLRGIVFLGGYFSHTEAELLQLQVPFVLSTIDVAGQVKKEVYSSVTVDDYSESYKLIRYLCELGHKDIVIITTDENDQSIGKLRLEGYRQALKDYQIKEKKELILSMEDQVPQYTMKNGYMVMKHFLEKKLDCTAVFAISDELAIGASRAILESGRKIPDDISVAGFDGIDTVRFYNPSITTIRQPIEEIAKESIHVLFDLIKKSKKYQHRVFEGELLVGESTAPPRSICP